MKEFLDAVEREVISKLDLFDSASTFLTSVQLPDFLFAQDSLPIAINAYKHFVENHSVRQSDDKNVFLKSQYIINFFQYRSVARLALNSEEVFNLIWKLNLIIAENCPGIKKQFTSLKSHDDLVNTSQSLFLMVSHVIYSSWNKWIDSYVEKELKERACYDWTKELYDVFYNDLIERHWDRCFVLRDNHNKLIIQFYKKSLRPINESYSNDGKKSEGDLIDKAFSIAVGLIPFIEKKDDDRLLRKSIASNPGCFALALYSRQLRTSGTSDSLKKIYKVAKTIKIAMSDEEEQRLILNIYGDSLSNDIDSLLSEPDLNVTWFKQAEKISNNIKNTLLFLEIFINDLVKNLLGIGRATPILYDIITQNLQFFTRVQEHIRNETLTFYSLHKLAQEYPYHLYRFNEKEPFFYTARACLFRIQPQISYASQVVLYYENNANKKYFFKDNLMLIKDNKFLSGLLKLFNQSNGFEQKCIQAFFSGFIRYIFKININSLEKIFRGSIDTLFDKILNHFTNLFFKQNKIIDIVYELEKLSMLPSQVSGTEIYDGCLLSEKDLNTVCQFFSRENEPQSNSTTHGKYICQLNEPVDGSQSYLLIYTKDHKIVGSGAFGEVRVAQKVYLKNKNPPQVDLTKFPQWVARKEILTKLTTDLNKHTTCQIQALEEKWRHQHIGNEYVGFLSIDQGAEIHLGFVFGENLGLQISKTPSSFTLISIIFQCLQQIQRFHLAGVTHCDIKDLNLLVHMDAFGFVHARLVDFGQMIGLLFSKNESSLRGNALSMPNSFLAALEKQNPLFDYDIYMDLFGLGATIMWDMLWFKFHPGKQAAETKSTKQEIIDIFVKRSKIKYFTELPDNKKTDVALTKVFDFIIKLMHDDLANSCGLEKLSDLIKESQHLFDELKPSAPTPGNPMFLKYA